MTRVIFDISINGVAILNTLYRSDGTNKLLARIRLIWESARSRAAQTVNSSHVCANWLTGCQIVEAEQQGRRRAGYGKSLLKDISSHLTHEYGVGFSVSALQYMRAFFLIYPHLLEKQHAVRVISSLSEPSIQRNKDATRGIFNDPSSEEWKPGHLHPGLSWTHYRALLKVDREGERSFYEIETIKSGWSARQLERQINSMLFFRLQKSKDKKGLLSLANKGQEILTPVDAIKDPYILEFLKLPESPRLVESKLETALLNMLKDFLLELGNGFAFVGRQERITLEGDHFYPDLVFYHARLKCYVIVELKTDKLTHADLGQMQLYVHYYDRNVAEQNDNPTLGLILCADKNDALVRYVLDKENRQIFASRYKLYLPSEIELRSEIRRGMRQLQENPIANRWPKKETD